MFKFRPLHGKLFNLATMTYNENARPSPLNDKEVRILQLLAEGKTGPEVADLMCLSENTIKWYRKRLRARFDASTTAQMVRKAVEEGIL